VGGTARTPAYVDDKIEPRDFLSLTIIFDHDVIDGAPAARFTRRLVELIEAGYGLDIQPTENVAVTQSDATHTAPAPA
jgi:pyruvate/2-oxoglutarate dehydrogenase complex dihydrolipoamide acyltransferase (E2) component